MTYTVVSVFPEASTAAATRAASGSVNCASMSSASFFPVTSVEVTKNPSGEPVITSSASFTAGGFTAPGAIGGAGDAVGPSLSGDAVGSSAGV